MADLIADFGVLGRSARSLTALHEEFAATSKTRAASRESLGSEQVSDAMADFAGNWDDTRASLMKSMLAVRDMTEHTLQGFRDMDDDLGRTLRQAGQ